MPSFLTRLFPTPSTRLPVARLALAFAIALGIDALQLAVGPFGAFPLAQVLDVLGFVVLARMLGFHLLLLPSFALELIPLADVLPTWTGCTAVVIVQHLRAHPKDSPQSGPGSSAVTPPAPRPGLEGGVGSRDL